MYRAVTVQALSLDMLLLGANGTPEGLRVIMGALVLKKKKKVGCAKHDKKAVVTSRFTCAPHQSLLPQWCSCTTTLSPGIIHRVAPTSRVEMQNIV